MLVICVNVDWTHLVPVKDSITLSQMYSMTNVRCLKCIVLVWECTITQESEDDSIIFWGSDTAFTGIEGLWEFDDTVGVGLSLHWLASVLCRAWFELP